MMTGANLVPTSSPLYISLYNYEDSKYEDSRYVLTSPRSLDACDKFLVKPAELLYKPLSELQDEYDDDLSFEEILQLYNEQEQSRLEKLQRCRDARLDIIEGETDPNKSTPIDENGNRKGKEIRTDELSPSIERTKLAVHGGRKDVLHSTLRRDKKQEDDPYYRIKFDQSDVSGVEKGDSEKSEKDFKRRCQTLTPASSHRSLSSRCSSAGLDRSVTSSWLNRSIQSARPIHDGALKKKLDGTNLSIYSHDEKILACLMRKEEDDIRRDKIRHLARTAWENQHDRTRRRQEKEEIERRQRITDSNYSREKIRLDREVDRDREFEDLQKVKRLQHEQRADNWERSMEKIHDQSMREIIEKKRKEFKRKKSQEERKFAHEREMKSYQEQVDSYQMAALRKAEEKKVAQVQDKAVKVTEKNKLERENQLFRLIEVEKQNKELAESMRSDITYKHVRAEGNVENIEHHRMREVEEKRLLCEERQKSTRVVVEHRDKVMKKYYQQLSDYHKIKEDQAQVIHEVTIEKKRFRAVEGRERWTDVHKKNLTKVQRMELAKQRECLDSIELKDFKTQKLGESREIAAQQLRNIAYNSQMLRDQLRERYGKDSFDKKVQKVQLEARLQ